MKWTAVASSVLALALAVSGCGAAADTFELDEEEAADEVRSAAWERLQGAWEAEVGARSHIVFTDTVEGRGRRYFADRPVQCVRAPCEPVREEGVYRATSRYLYLSRGGTTQRFSYVLRAGTLTLRQGTRVAARLHSVPSYCREVADCGEQSYPVVQCIGYDVCERNRCGFRCGEPPAPGGCTQNADCGAGQYCQRASCGGTGSCATRPDFCTAQYAPVCGCDGRTYSNACAAAQAGVSVASADACR